MGGRAETKFSRPHLFFNCLPNVLQGPSSPDYREIPNVSARHDTSDQTLQLS
jgi:hypothetical protein